MVKKPALGKGLGAIIAEANQNYQKNDLASVIKSGPAAVSEIPLDQIEPNPYQPRATFDEEALAELAESIKTLGIIQPITLRQLEANKYQIISGERRFRASQAAGLKTIPAYIRKADDGAMLEMAIVENIQRENLDAIETALSFQRLIDECNLTQEGMADRVGKKRATITNYLRLLKLPEEIQAAIKIGKVSVGHAKVLLGVEDTAKQISLCESLIKEDWSVRQLEQKVKVANSVKQDKPEDGKEEEPQLPQMYYTVAENIGRHFGNKVSVKRSAKGSGTITIHFDNDSQVEDFLKDLLKDQPE
ncbi:MAG: ParB/RepB/Spo0J family partition protein [Bacteroidales bacterium]|nr:ParB/RepB/Spo0J family partition protein [Candidatus Cacconaster merdequi]